MTKLFGSVDSSCVAGRQSVTVSTEVGVVRQQKFSERSWGGVTERRSCVAHHTIGSQGVALPLVRTHSRYQLG